MTTKDNSAVISGGIPSNTEQEPLLGDDVSSDVIRDVTQESDIDRLLREAARAGDAPPPYSTGTDGTPPYFQGGGGGIPDLGDSEVAPSPSAAHLGLEPDQGSKVTFEIGEDKNVEDTKKSKEKKRHSVTQAPDISLKRQAGSEVKLSSRPVRSATDADEASGLVGADLDDIASHRLADPKGTRHRKGAKQGALASVVHISRPLKPGVKPQYDHQPHEMFVELDELYLGSNEDWVWEEKARWIKFEEDLEEGTDRWGKPHVASLSFHSLLQLRTCLEKGAILLDLDAADLPAIATCIVDQLVAEDQLPAESKGNVLKALLLKHKHVDEKTGLSQKISKFPRRASSGSIRRSSSGKNISQEDNTPNGSANDVKVEIKKADTTPKLKKVPTSSKILNRIPDGSESTTVLIGSVEFLNKPIMAFVRLSEGRQLGNLTEVPLPVRFMFLLMGPKNTSLDYHEIGRSISTLMSNTSFHDEAYRAEERGDLLNAINDFLEQSMVLPPGELNRKTLLPIMNMARKKQHEQEMAEKARKKKEMEALAIQMEKPEPPEDPLARTGRLFGGMINDIKRRYPKYLSDITDAFNLQCLSTVIFIYFACLSPAITFGGLLSEKSGQLLGVSEMLIMVAGCGIIFSLFACQPITVVGATGPILVFEEGLVQICEAMDLELLPMRAWVGIWTAVIAILLVMFEGSFLVRYFTRFTEEVFSSLISLIFIMEVFFKLARIFDAHPLQPYYPEPADGSNNTESLAPSIPENLTAGDNSTGEETGYLYPQPNTALLSVILCFGTFFIAYFMKQFRNSKFLGRPVRRALGDFGVPMAILVMVLIDYFLIKDTYTEKLIVPDGFSVTLPEKRGWFINPLGMEKKLPVWAMFMAILMALLVFILIFMETQIVSMIMNKSERNLKKGSGYFFDLALIGSFGLISGLVGLPFLCAATVRSVTHMSAVTIISTNHAPGEKPKLAGAHEQRMTGLLVHILIGVSVLLGPLLRQVPLAVLFGIFLYMGVASMSGIQMLERVELLFMPIKHHPDVIYVRNVRTRKMHLFTFLQLVALAVLWAVKSTAAALAFPFILLILVPIRLKLLPKIFSKLELSHLDNDGTEKIENDEEDEPDFFTQVHNLPAEKDHGD